MFRKGILCGIGIAVVLMLILFLGYQMYLYPQEKGLFYRDTTEGLDLNNAQLTEKMKTIEDLINDHYLNEVDQEQVEEMLYTGLVYGLGDPYAAYYTAEEYRSLLDSTNGSYCGIGAMFSQNMLTGVISVIKVYEGFPAYEAGMRPGDVLYAVEGEPATGQDLTQLVSTIKGEEGTYVHLTMIREDVADYLEMDVERRPIEIPTIEARMMEDNIGYVAVSEFDLVTSQQYAQAIEDLKKQGMKGLIVDIRNNGGGVFQTVCEMVDMMVPKGLIVYTEDKNGRRSEARSDAAHYFDQPLVVLVNGHSASASEIFAGAIQDHKIGTIVGTTTYGKGIVQQGFQLEDGSAVKLTISKYFTPNGNDIHGKGIEPDVVVELDEELQGKAVIDPEEDNQLQKAMEVLREKMKE